MKNINLRDYYPFYQHDFFIDVSDEVVTLFEAYERKTNYKKSIGKCKK